MTSLIFLERLAVSQISFTVACRQLVAARSINGRGSGGLEEGGEEVDLAKDLGKLAFGSPVDPRK